MLTVVHRLEKREWLRRTGSERSFRYVAARKRSEATGRLAAKFVDDFFDGSASRFVMSLLGSKKIKPDEIHRLRELLRTREGKE